MPTDNWKKLISSYSERTTDKNAEDMIARRIWKGLGVSGTIKNISGIEKYLYNTVYYKDPLYDRTYRLFESAYFSKYNRYNFITRTLCLKNMPLVQGYLPDNYKDKYYISDTNLVTPKREIPLFFVRIVDYTKCVVIVDSSNCLNVDDNRVVPPATLLPISDDNKFVLLTKEISEFISGFGPYSIFDDIKYTEL